MRKSKLLTLAPLTLLLTIAATAAAQTNPPEGKEAASVAGRVTQGGRPAPGADVVLLPGEWSPRMRPVARVKADDQGRYKLTGVPPGRYHLSPVSPGFVFDELNTSSWMPGKVINLTAGEEVKDMDFALARGGVVTGRVTDSEGRPVVECYVTLIPADANERRKRQRQDPLIYATDDRGVYRVWDLAPGRYLVYAGRSSDNTYALGDEDAADFYPQTFHPSTTDESQARVVEVTAGSVAEQVDIALGKMLRTYEASGRVVDDDGRALPGVYVNVGPLSPDGREMTGHSSNTGRTDERGEFRAKGLMPGRWGAWGVGAAESDIVSGKQGATYGDMVSFEVAERNVEGLELRMSRGATVSGVVSIEGTSDPNVLAARSGMKLWVRVETPPGAASPPGHTRMDVKPDGTFQVTGLRPGRVHFDLAWPRLKGLSPLHLKREGVDQPGGLEVRKGEHVKDVHIAYAYGTAVVRGQVQFRGGARPAGARFFAQTRRAGGTSPVTGWGEVDALGRFVIENLSAGEYELLLVDVSTPDAPGDKRQPVARQAINVPDGGELRVTLLYDLSAKPKGNEP